MTRDDALRELVEVARAVVRVNELQTQARSSEADLLLSDTARRAREALAVLGEGGDADE